jgi:hypothetical protein
MGDIPVLQQSELKVPDDIVWERFADSGRSMVQAARGEVLSWIWLQVNGPSVCGSVHVLGCLPTGKSVQSSRKVRAGVVCLSNQHAASSAVAIHVEQCTELRELMESRVCLYRYVHCATGT